MRRTLLSIVVGAALCGCATAPLTRADVDGTGICNVDRMSDVERAAKREFKDIRWVHCPQALRAL
jgi:hypothetical protein